METWMAPAVAGVLVLLALTVMGCAPARGRTLAGSGALVAVLTVTVHPLLGLATGGTLLATGSVLVLAGGGMGRRRGDRRCWTQPPSGSADSPPSG